MKHRVSGLAVARWLCLAAGVGVTLVLLNGVMANHWAASFHDTYREVYLHRAFLCTWYGVAALLVTAALFTGSRAVRRTRVVVALLAGALTAAAAPHVRAFLLEDRCLDSGGRWDATTFRCEH